MLTQKQASELKPTLNEQDERLQTIFNALGDHGRFCIFKILLERREVCVTDIANICNVSVPAASQQLRVLELSNLVIKKRMGQMICYEVRAEEPLIKSLIPLIK